MKICTKCKISKNIEDFTLTSKGYTIARCKVCVRKAANEYYSKYKLNESYVNKRRISNLKAHYVYFYGITYEDKLKMYDQQNGLCMICNNKMILPRGCYVDHDHSTGKVRDLLCAKCNTGLGYFENKDFLEKAKGYIKKHEI